MNRKITRLRDRLRYRWRMLKLGWRMRPMAGAEDPPETPPAPPAPTDPPPKPAEKTLTQADVDRIVQERIAREREKFKDYDELREKAGKLDEIEEAQKSELEKAQEAQRRAEKAAAEAKATANTTLRRAAIISAAAEAGVDPEIAHALLSDRGFKVVQDDKTIEVTVGDDGQVTGATEAVKALAEQKQLVGSPTPTPPGEGGARTPATPADLDEQIREAEKAGDFSKSMRLKNQKLVEQMAEAN